MSRFVRGLLAALLLVVLTACGESSEITRNPIAVTGHAGTAPEMSFDAPHTVDSADSREIWPGDGPELVAGGPVLLHMYGEDGRDHSVLTNTYTSAPRSFTLDKSSLGAGMTAALRGQRAGARILYEEMTGGIPVILVLDILPSRAYGEALEPVEGFPTVVTDEWGVPTITVPEAEAPQDLAVQPLIRGSGSQVEAGQFMTVRYTSVVWSTGEVLSSNWTDLTVAPQTTVAGIGAVNEGWDQGLFEQTVGSQVLLVVPPDFAYGGTNEPMAEETLVYVIDILDAFTPYVEPTEEGS